MPNPFTGMDFDEILEQVALSEQEWRPRWDQIGKWRDLRFGRDDVLSSIPAELQSTNFQYHSPVLDQSITELSSFLSAAEPVWTVDPTKAGDKTRADNIESLLRAAFGANGVFETESGGEVMYSVWENQCENGMGVYKMTLKKDYILAIPQRKFADDDSDEEVGWEPNPDYNPRSRKGDREEKGQSKYRETDDSLDARRDAFSDQEFPFQRRRVDPRTFFYITQDGVIVGAGEVNARPATVLDEHGREDLRGDYVYMGEAKPTQTGDESGSRPLVNTFEFWTDEKWCFGFTTPNNDDRTGARQYVLSGNEEYASGTNHLRRVPYFIAHGLPSTDTRQRYTYTGAFMSIVSELPLLNHLETMHFNAVHRGYFPVYYPVKDQAYQGRAAALDIEPLIGVTQADMERTELPPGWRWDVMPSGFEPDLMKQLEAVRSRVEKSAIREVLSGITGTSGESAAHLSLVINAAQRAMSPFVRHHEAPLQEMAETILETAKRLRLDLNVSTVEQRDDGSRLRRQITVKAEDIVTTAVSVRLDPALPVDQAALETRGITLVDNGKMSYETAAPDFFRIADPVKEKNRIRLERRDTQIDDIAFNMAAMRWQQQEPVEFAAAMQNIQPLQGMGGSAGGGPGGAYGGASALNGRGAPAQPNAPQVEAGGAF